MTFQVGIFICGVQKSGTTTLANHLARHPGLSTHRGKEAHFFDRREATADPAAVAGYHARFACGGHAQAYDSTPSYFYVPEALPRLARYNPDARLIVLFRHPVARALSHWRMNRHRGIEPLGFAEAIAAEPARTALDRYRGPDGKARPSKSVAYLDRGFYGRQLARALQHFSLTQMLLLPSASLFEDHAQALERVAAFLDLPPFPPTPARHDFATPDDGTEDLPDAGVLESLRLLYAEDLALFGRLGGPVLPDAPSRPAD